MEVAMLTTVELARKLETVFERRQASVLATVITNAYSDLVKTGDFNELKGIVRELAEAQKRTDERVGVLAQRMEELAEAQKRTDERVGVLAQRMEELAEAQKRTEESVRSLAQGLQDTRSEVGGLSRTISYALENEAYRALPAFLKARYGLELTQRLVRTEVLGEEVNFFAKARRDDQGVTIVGETKLRLDERRAEGRGAEQILETLERKIAVVQRAYPGETVVPLLVTHFARPAFLREAEAQGVIVVQSFEW
jgi:DNA repair exonuclease SbcCD ATPase subunit